VLPLCPLLEQGSFREQRSCLSPAIVRYALMGVLLQGQRSLSNAVSTQPGVRLRVQWRVHAGAPLELATLSSAYREGAENSVRLPISIHSFTSSLPGKRLIVSRRTSHGCEDIALCMDGAKSTALTRLLGISLEVYQFI
jgi:hypothetical protein